jgi:c-di-GMP phosphodiesterase
MGVCILGMTNMGSAVENVENLATEEEAIEIEAFYLSRQPILNRKEELIAYALLFYTHDSESYAGDALSLTATTVDDADEVGTRRIIRSSQAFMSVNPEVLMGNTIFTLSRQRLVMEIPGSIELTDELLSRIATFTTAGYQFAIADVTELSPRIDKLMPFAKVIKINVTDMAEDNIAALGKYFKSKHKLLLANGVDTDDKFNICKKHYFDLFQGFFFTRPDKNAVERPSQLTLRSIFLLTMILNGENNFEIVQNIDQDPLLKKMLLHLLNSPLHGLPRKIESLDHLLLVLGHRILKRFLQMVMYAKPDEPSPLLTLAATRGKMCELLAENAPTHFKIKPHVAFTIGVMSFADALLHLDIAKVLNQIGETDEVCDALLSHSGDYGELLELVALYDAPQLFDTEKIDQLLDKFALTTLDFFSLQQQAFSWGESIAEHIATKSRR